MRVSPLLFASLLILITSCSKPSIRSRVPIYTIEEAKKNSLNLNGKTIRVRGPFHSYIESGGVIRFQIGKRGNYPIVECIFPLEAHSSLAGLTGEIVVEGVVSSSSPGDLVLRKAHLISP